MSYMPCAILRALRLIRYHIVIVKCWPCYFILRAVSQTWQKVFAHLFVLISLFLRKLRRGIIVYNIHPVGLGDLLEGRSPYNVVLVDQVLHVDVHNWGHTLILCISTNRRLPRSAENFLFQLWVIPLLGMIGAKLVSLITLLVVLFEILRVGGIQVECL